MTVSPISLMRERTPEVYREAILLSTKITILLGAALLFYTLSVILQQIYSSTGLILLSIGTILLLTMDRGSNTSLTITTAHKLREIGEHLGHVVVCITNKLCEEPIINDPHFEMKCPGNVAIWSSYVAYGGLLVQVFFRYPVSLDTFFAGGFIALAVCASHTYLFSCMWNSDERKSLGQNLYQVDGRNKNVGEDELKEVKAKYNEERQKWEEEKKDLMEQLQRAKSEASKHIKKEKDYSMFGNFDWD